MIKQMVVIDMRNKKAFVVDYSLNKDLEEQLNEDERYNSDCIYFEYDKNIFEDLKNIMNTLENTDKLKLIKTISEEDKDNCVDWYSNTFLGISDIPLKEIEYYMEEIK